MARQRSIQVVRYVLLGLVTVAVLGYPMDWLVWTVRHQPTDSIQMEHYTETDLKGNKEGWDPDATFVVTCSQSLFGQTGSGACWWVRQHTQQVDRYGPN